METCSKTLKCVQIMMLNLVELFIAVAVIHLLVCSNLDGILYMEAYLDPDSTTFHTFPYPTNKSLCEKSNHLFRENQVSAWKFAALKRTGIECGSSSNGGPTVG